MINQFLQYIEYEKHYSSHTLFSYRRDLLQFLDYIKCDMESFSPSGISSTDIQRWILSLFEEGKSSRTISRKISSLKSLWRFLMMRGYAEKNPTKKIELPKTKKPLPVFYRHTEMRNAICVDVPESSFESLRDRLIVRLFYETGIRVSELVGVKVADVLLDERQLKVIGKRNKQRIIPIGDGLCEEIRRYLKVREEVEVGDEALFLRKTGESVYIRLVYRIVNASLSRVSTKQKQSPHTLRHTFATTLINEGADINAVKDLLGHSSLAATQIYTHVNFEKLNTIYKQAHPRAKKKGK